MPSIVDVTLGTSDEILFNSGYVLGGGACIVAGGGTAGVSGTNDKGGAADLRPKAAADVGRGPREGGHEGGADNCLEEELEPVLAAGVEYGAEASHASRIIDGEEVIFECAVRSMLGVPTDTIVEN